MRAPSLIVWGFLLVAGCGGARAGTGVIISGDGGEPCMAGSQSSCLCVDGRSGTSVCSAAGVAGVCVCGVDVLDGSVPNDLGVSLPDVPGGFDAGPSIDVVTPRVDVVPPGPGTLGAPCTRLSDCMSGVCLPSGRCSRPCGGVSDCPSSWSCTSLPGLGPVCGCTPRGAEVCNDIDDDCNGQVDEGTTRCSNRCVDVRTDSANCGACGIACGGGTSCVNGACACPSGRSLACGGVCVDGRTDASNCGACGNVCGAGSTCTNGVCQRTGMCPSSCSVSSQCAPCATPGETGSYCCVSGLCIYMSTSTCGGGPVDSGLPDVTLPRDTGGGDTALD